MYAFAGGAEGMMTQASIGLRPSLDLDWTANNRTLDINNLLGTQQSWTGDGLAKSLYANARVGGSSDKAPSPTRPSDISTFARASGATMFGTDGNMVSVNTNVPRESCWPGVSSRTNYVRNSVGLGASAAPSTVPTNWSIAASPGLTATVTAIGVEAGINYIAVNIAGTASASGYTTVAFEAIGQIAALAGQPIAHSVFVKQISNSGVAGIALAIQEYDGSSAALTQTLAVFSASNVALNTQRQQQTTAVAGATTASIVPQFIVSVASGSTVNATYWIGLPQVGLQCYVSEPIPTNGSSVTVPNAPRGILMESTSTNSVPNPRCEGSVPGTPGTTPTGWLTGVTTGQTVVGSSYENGIPYLEIDYTPTGSIIPANPTVYTIQPHGNTAVAASVGQVWTASTYIRLVTGSLAGVVVSLVVGMYDSSSNLLQQTVQTVMPMVGALATQRFTATGAAAPAGTAYAVMTLQVAVLTGASVYLRVGAPQFELSTFATSCILPTIGSPAITTRAEDTYGITQIEPWFNRGTLRTNLVNYSALNGGTTLTAATLTTGQTSPSGTTNAVKLCEDGTAAQHMVAVAIAGIAYPGLIYTLSVYAKAAERSVIYLNVPGQTYVQFDLSAGSVVSGGSAADVRAPTMTVVPGGWYRCSVSFLLSAIDTNFFIGLINGTNVYTGTAGNGVLVWGAQMELAQTDNLPGALIPTSGSPVTAQEIGAGTICIGSVTLNPCVYTVQSGLMILSDGSNSNVMTLFSGANGQTVSLVNTAGFGQYEEYESVLLGYGLPSKFARAFSPDNATSGSAGVIGSSTTPVPYNINYLGIGRSQTAYAWTLNGFINRVTYWPRKMSDAELQQTVN